MSNANKRTEKMADFWEKCLFLTITCGVGLIAYFVNLFLTDDATVEIESVRVVFAAAVIALSGVAIIFIYLFIDTLRRL